MRAPSPTARSFAAALLAAAVAAASLAAASGCGRKLPPAPPGAKAPAAVQDLAATLEGAAVTLLWTHAAAPAEGESQTAGYKVFRARRDAAEADCTDCPAPFKLIGELSARRMTPGSRVRFRDEIEPGYRYRYKVVAISAEGAPAADSNVVEAGR